MIEIFGPTYRYRGEILRSPQIIFVNDHHYDENLHCFHIKSLLDNSECDPQQHLLVFDHMAHEDQLQHFNHISLPIFCVNSAQEFKQQEISTNWHNKTHAFNFMINKPRPNRAFLLLLIEHFGLTDYVYSLCWKNNQVNRSLLTANTQSPLYHSIIENTPMSIQDRYFTFGHEVFLDQGLRSGHMTNAANYKSLLQNTVFEPSCVSLITEPSFYERETLQTEKTIMAIYGGTLPIWVGGWGIPNSMRSLGFDVFDDIVDHSYEYLSDPWDRAYEAVAKNLHLLKDFARVKDFVMQNQNRLKHNLDLVTQNVFLDYCDQKTQHYDDAVKSCLYELYTNSGSVKITQKLF